MLRLIGAWCVSRWALLLVEAGVVGAGVFALLQARDEPAVWGSVLILMVTAMVAAWYADETRRMAHATCEMARSTFYTASKEAGADLVVSARDFGVDDTTTDVNVLTNEGAGPAFAVQVHLQGIGQCLAFSEIRPGHKESLPRASEVRLGAIVAECRDVIQAHRDVWQWNADRNTWERKR